MAGMTGCGTSVCPSKDQDGRRCDWVFKMQHSLGLWRCPNRCRSGQGFAARESALAPLGSIRSLHPLMAAGSGESGVRSAPSRPHRSPSSTAAAPRYGAASVGQAVHPFDPQPLRQGTSIATGICEWGRHGHETRLHQSVIGTARPLGTSYRSRMQSRCNRACSMHPPRLRSAPTLICHPQWLGGNSHSWSPEAAERALPSGHVALVFCAHRKLSLPNMSLLRDVGQQHLLIPARQLRASPLALSGISTRGHVPSESAAARSSCPACSAGRGR